MEGPNSPRHPRVLVEGAFGVVVRPTSLQSGCARRRLGAGEVGPTPASHCPRVPMESIKAPAEPVWP